MNDHELDKIAKSYADEIIEECDGDCDDAMDLAHQYADGSEHVIYYYRAHQICQNCNTELGEQFLEDVGPGETPTYNSLATIIAYGELYGRICVEIDLALEERDQATS